MSAINYNNITKKLEQLNLPVQIYGNITNPNIYRTFHKISKYFYELFDIPKNQQKTDCIDDNLYSIIEFETCLHYSSSVYQNKRKAILNYLISEPASTPTDDVEAFFMPYFNSNLFELNNTAYFIDFKNKFYEFFTFYKCLSDTTKNSDTFKYVIDDLKTFIRCLYTHEQLPQRDYNEIYNFITTQQQN